MLSLILIIGVLFIALGIVVKKAPQLIAGFRKVKGKKVRKDIAADVSQASLITGAVIIIGGLLCHQMEWYVMAFMFVFVPPFAMVIWLQIELMWKGSRQTGKINKTHIWVIVLLLAIFVTCFVGFYKGNKEADVVVENNIIEITGMYGKSAPANEVLKVELKDTMPSIVLRNGGFSLANVRKGKFQLEDGKEAWLFLHSFSGPYIYIETKEGLPAYINYEDNSRTKEIYENIKEMLKK